MFLHEGLYLFLFLLCFVELAGVQLELEHRITDLQARLALSIGSCANIVSENSDWKVLIETTASWLPRYVFLCVDVMVGRVLDVIEEEEKLWLRERRRSNSYDGRTAEASRRGKRKAMRLFISNSYDWYNWYPRISWAVAWALGRLGGGVSL